MTCRRCDQELSGAWPRADGRVPLRQWAGKCSREPMEVQRRRGYVRYRRHPKPPYSYLALIALVIRAAPGRRLKLAQIIQELSSLFPFFGGGYQGWKDSVRHNLSCNPCFAKVLKDPSKPKAKGNYWTVDVSRIPPAALRLQNTAVARGGDTFFARDLAPFILRGCPYPPPRFKSPSHLPKPPPNPLNSSPSPPQPPPPFSIASLLGDFSEGGRKFATPPPSSASPEDHPPGGNLWGSTPILHLPTPPWLPSTIGGSSSPSSNPTGDPQIDASPSKSSPEEPIPGELGGVGAQTMPPPNKSIFDVWLSHPGDIVAPAFHM
ncbi:forkhead box protein H1 [Pogoniulus pusillus]|uniref:forkhead box protein H1 n=1 Tax=Pogoniulus pusillus TaxID=488313 RepID=UPI0030B94E61